MNVERRIPFFRNLEYISSLSKHRTIQNPDILDYS